MQRTLFSLWCMWLFLLENPFSIAYVTTSLGVWKHLYQNIWKEFKLSNKSHFTVFKLLASDLYWY